MNFPPSSCRRLLVLHAAAGPDYLADMLWISLLTQSGFSITSNRIPEYLYKGYSGSHLYGRGFTLYGKLGPEDVPEICSREQISASLLAQDFDLVVYTSIRRYHDLFSECVRCLGRRRVLSVDGEDDQFINVEYALNSTHFKRELSILGGLVVRRLSFFLPHFILESIRQALPEVSDKCHLLAPCDPRDVRTYVYHSEESYFNQYSASWFGYTCKKSGWDCLRHYEIVACGCLPFFDGFANKPFFTMFEYPRFLQNQANELYINAQVAGTFSSGWLARYDTLSFGFQEWMEQSALRNHLAAMLKSSSLIDHVPQLLKQSLSPLILFLSNMIWRFHCLFSRIHRSTVGLSAILFGCR